MRNQRIRAPKGCPHPGVRANLIKKERVSDMPVPQRKKKSSPPMTLGSSESSLRDRARIQELCSQIVDLIGRDHLKAARILEDWIQDRSKNQSKKSMK